MSDPPAGYPVVVLAGGLGTRMAHIAPDLPKALVPVLGEPFAFHQLRLLAAQGVRDVLYVVGHLGARIREAVGDGRTFDLAVAYVDERESLHGTAGALRLALDRGVLPETFGVLYGDSYLPIDLAPVWRAFSDDGRPALMTVFRNERLWDSSNAVFGNGTVLRYDKDPAAHEPAMEWIDYGFSVLERSVVDRIPTDSVVDLADVYRDLSRRGELAGYEVSERFYEVGSPGGLAELEDYLGAAFDKA